MKLASALSERADLQKRLSQLQVRLSNNAKVQEGEKPSEDPEDLLKELDEMIAQYEDLVSRINLTNSKTEIDGVTITQLIARRDALKWKISILRSFLEESGNKIDRYSRTEIKIESTVDVAKKQKELDRLSKELRETDEKIQELNWTVELL